MNMRQTFLIVGLLFFSSGCGYEEKAPIPTKEEKTTPSCRSDIPLEQVLRVNDAIRPGDPIKKVTDYLGPPPDMPKNHHGWNYAFAWGKPHDNNTPKASVKVRFDGNAVSTISLHYRPALKTVEAAQSLLRKGSTQEEVTEFYAYPDETHGNQWLYHWLYKGTINSWSLRITFDEEKQVSDVRVSSCHADFW